jgi:hypothetical protein
MASIDWLNAVSGAFGDAADWSGGAVPGAADDAILDAPGTTAYTVTSAASQTVAAIETSATATLDIAANTFAATDATGAGANAGTISVADGAILSLGGTLNGAGLLFLDGTDKGADLTIGAAGLTLTGGGEVTLGDALAAPFQPCPPKYSIDRVTSASGSTITDVDDTISGAGLFGMGTLGLVNEAGGVIDASLPTDLLVQVTGTLVNQGLIEATGAGGLYINYTVVDNASGGVISANGGIVYTEAGDTIIGGTLTASGAGFFCADGDAILDGSTAGPLTIRGRFYISNKAVATLEGAIVNTYQIDVGNGPASSGSSSLLIGAGGATLTGGGEVLLGGQSPENNLSGLTSAATLTNVDNTILGTGEVGAGQLTMINEAHGVIDADYALVIDTGAAAVANAGLIEATGRGQLTIEGVIDNAAGGRVEGLADGAITLEGATIEAGAISLDGQAGDASLIIGAGGATLTGGALTLAAGNAIEGGPASATLTNAGDQIVGLGEIGGAALTLVNGSAGAIKGAGAGALVVDTGANTIVNAGQIQADNSCDVTLASPVDNTGHLSADGGDLTVEGAVTGGGVGDVQGGTLDFLSTFSQNVAFTSASPRGVLELAQSRDYDGTIYNFSQTGSTALDLEDIAFTSGVTTATFAGTSTSGVLTVTNGTETATINLEGDYFGASFVVASDGHGGSLVTDPSEVWAAPVSGAFGDAADWSGGAVPASTSAAVLDAPGSGAYTVTSSGNRTVASLQTAAAATLDIASGLFAATAGSGAGANAGVIAVSDGAILFAGGTLDNTGVLFLDGTAKGADLEIAAGGLTLTGGGVVDMGDTLAAPFQPCPPAYSIDEIANAAGGVLTNVDNTIVGAGCIGLGQIGLVNEAAGVIDASLPTDLLLQAAGTLMNTGLIESTGAGGLYFQQGSIIDNAAGGTISANGGIVYTEPDDVIIGGTLTSSGKGYFYVDFGDLTLDGSTAGALTSHARILATATTEITLEGDIDNAGQLIVGAGPTSFGDATLSIAAAGATLTGGGEVVLDGEDAQTPLTGATAAATLTNVDNTISGEGLVGAGDLTLVNQAAGVIDADYAMALDTGAGSLSNAGLIEATGAGDLTIQSPMENSGEIFADGAPITDLAAVTGAGGAMIEDATLTFAAAFSQNVAFEGDYGELVLADSQAYSGAISGFATNGSTSIDLEDIAFVGGSMTATYSGTAASGVLTVSNGTQSASVALGGDYLASTFAVLTDGHGGTIVVDPPTGRANAIAAPVRRFVAAAAAMGAGGGPTARHDVAPPIHPPLLARPGAIAA